MEHRWQNCVNATMDVMIIKELCRNWISAAHVLDVHPAEIKKLKQWMAKLPDYQISDHRITSYNVCYTKLLRVLDQMIYNLDIL